MSAIFAVYYAVSNTEPILAEPRSVAPMFGSLAQFVLPMGVAAAAFQVLAIDSLGLRTMFATGVRQATIWMYAELFWFWLINLLIFAAFALYFLALPLVQGVPPQLSFDYVAYPGAALFAGLAVGHPIGVVMRFVMRPARLGTAYLLSFSAGLGGFLMFVLQGGSATDARFSLSLGAAVLDQYQRIDPTAMWLQISGAVLGAIAVAGITLVVLERPRSIRVLVVLSCATVVAGTIAGVVVDRLGNLTTQPILARGQGDTRCIDGAVRVCYWVEERPGAELLVDAFSETFEQVPSQWRPALIVQQGVQRQSTGQVAAALDMPRDEQQAAVYAAELTIRAAGCSSQAIGERRELRQLLEGMLPNSKNELSPASFTALGEC